MIFLVFSHQQTFIFYKVDQVPYKKKKEKKNQHGLLVHGLESFAHED